METFRNECTEWLLSKGRSAPDLVTMLSGLCELMIRHDLPIDRATLGVPLLHPIAQSNFCTWDPETGGISTSLIWDDSRLEMVRNSPMHGIYSSGLGTEWRLDDPKEVSKFSVGPELALAGFTHYLAYPIAFADGSFKAITAQTKQRGGFTDQQRLQLKSVLLPLAAATEHHVQNASAATLLNTFIGMRAGKRVLDGQIHRGDGDMIRSVIWMSDLIGFTDFANSRSANDLLDGLNHCFEVTVDAIVSEGGEVLKFIGDAVLGIFPYGDCPSEAVKASERAVRTVLDAKRQPDWPTGLDCGIGLHIGDVFFGNIGSKTRLDFTVIGQSVNLVSRVEALCRPLSSPVLVTEAFRDASTSDYTDRGKHSLKGFAEQLSVFSPEFGPKAR